MGKCRQALFQKACHQGEIKRTKTHNCVETEKFQRDAAGGSKLIEQTLKRKISPILTTEDLFHRFHPLIKPHRMADSAKIQKKTLKTKKQVMTLEEPDVEQILSRPKSVRSRKLLTIDKFIVCLAKDYCNNKKRSHIQLDSRKQVIAFQDRVITINIKEAQHPLK